MWPDLQNEPVHGYNLSNTLYHKSLFMVEGVSQSKAFIIYLLTNHYIIINTSQKSILHSLSVNLSAM